MKWLNSLSDWKTSSLINEDVNAAKSWLVKTGKIKEPSQAKTIDDYNQIIVLMTKYKTPAYTYTFLRLRMEQNAPYEILDQILSKLKDDRLSRYIADLPRKVGDYAKITSVEGHANIPGYEVLMDDLTELENVLDGMWLVKKFIKNGGRDQGQSFNQVEAWKKESSEFKLKFLKLASTYKTISDKSPKDASGKVLIEQFGNRILSATSLDGLYSELETAVNSTAVDSNEIAEELATLSGTKILWMNSKIVIAAFMKPGDLGKMCSTTQWCIRPNRFATSGMGGRWYANTNGEVQYVVFDSTKAASDPTQMVGLTVNSAGKYIQGNIKSNSELPWSISSLNDLLKIYKVPDAERTVALNKHKEISDHLVKHMSNYKQEEDIISGRTSAMTYPNTYRDLSRAFMLVLNGEFDKDSEDTYADIRENITNLISIIEPLFLENNPDGFYTILFDSIFRIAPYSDREVSNNDYAEIKYTSKLNDVLRIPTIAIGTAILAGLGNIKLPEKNKALLIGDQDRFINRANNMKNNLPQDTTKLFYDLGTHEEESQFLTEVIEHCNKVKMWMESNI